MCSVELMSHIYGFLFVHHWFSFLFLRCSNCEIYSLPSMLPYSCFSSSLFFDSIQGMLVEGPPGPSGPAVSITFFPHSSHMEKLHRKKHVMENVSMELAWVFLCMLHYICMSFFQGLPGTPGIQGSPGLHGDPGERVSWRFSENPPSSVLLIMLFVVLRHLIDVDTPVIGNSSPGRTFHSPFSLY